MIYDWVITHILPLEKVGANQISKRTVILEEVTDKERKGWVAIDFLKDKCDLVEGLQVWDVVSANLNLRVNEYNWRRYNGITCWKIDKKGWESQWEASLPPEAKEWFQETTYNDELPF